MTSPLNRPWLWLSLILVAAAVQYLAPALEATRSGVQLYWGLPRGALDSAGPERFLKDVVCIIFGAIWPILVRWRQQVVLYFIWLVGTLLLGLVAYALGTGFPPALVVGLRWVLLVHAAFGLYFLIHQHGLRRQDERYLLFCLAGLCGLAVAVSLLQMMNAGGLGSMGVARLPGIFSLGGTNGYFMAGASIIVFACSPAHTRLKLAIYGLSLVGAILSGTRFAVLSIVIILYAEAVALLARRRVLASQSSRALVHSIAIPIVTVAGIAAASSVTGRGDLIADQLSGGGRAANGLEIMGRLAETATLSDWLFGRGIGMGTNGAAALVDGGARPEWQILVDNSFVTGFIQFGLLGLLWFVGGLVVMLGAEARRVPMLIYVLILLSAMTQNLPEQIFLVIAFGFFFGAMRRRFMENRQATAQAPRPGAAVPLPVGLAPR